MLFKLNSFFGKHKRDNFFVSSFNFTFKTGTNADYKIYSVDGAFIKSGKMTSNKSQVSLSDSPDGIYFIHITNESSINQIVKLIK